MQTDICFIYQNNFLILRAFILHASDRTCSPYRTCQSQVNLQEMESEVVLDMFCDDAIKVFVSFYSGIFFQFIFKLSAELSKTISTFLNQHLQFILSKIRVQIVGKTVSDFTTCNNFIGPDTNIVGDS